MKSSLLKTAATTSLAASFLMMLSACNGQSSNPLEKYKDVKGDPYTGTTPQSEKQNEVSSKFSLEIISAVSTFIESQPGKIQLALKPKSLDIGTYSLAITSFSMDNQQPQLQPTDKPGIYDLTWTPPIGSSLRKDLKLKLQAKVLTASDMRLVGTGDPFELNINVSIDGSEPYVVDAPKLEAGVDEGYLIPYVIVIEDPATATMPGAPDVVIRSHRNSNTEAYAADGASKLTPDNTKVANVERVGTTTRWKFHYVLNTKELPLNHDREGKPDPTASTVDLCFYIDVRSVRGTYNTQTGPQRCIRARYMVQAPELSWEAAYLTEIKSGVETQLKFTIKSINGLGTTELKDVERQISSLSGKKSISCSLTSLQNLNSKTCVLAWTPTCSATAKTQKVSLKVDNTLGGKTKSQRFEKEFTLLANEELCPKKSTRPTTKGGVQ